MVWQTFYLIFEVFLAKITPQKFKTPEKLDDVFDWDLLFQLIAGSFSSKYWFSEITGYSLDELFVEVKHKSVTIKKKISELWSFQIIRLFEIYCEEQMKLQILFSKSIKDKDRETIKGIKKEREKRIAPHRKIKKLVKETLSPALSVIENKEVYFYCSLESAFNIIKSGVIYSSDLSYMNDADELTFGIDILIAALKEIVSKEDTADDLKSWLKTVIYDEKKIRDEFKKRFCIYFMFHT